MSDAGTTTTDSNGGAPPTTTEAGDELGRARAEAASWRRRLRETEQAHAAALDAARAEGRAESSAKLVDAYVVAGASGRFANVADALQLVDRTKLVGADGMPDTDAIATALDGLLTERPHLAARRFAGSADQGVRTTGPSATGDWVRDLMARDTAQRP